MEHKTIKEMTINERIRYFRILRGFTQAEVAEKMGMKVGSYSKMEREGKITVEKLIKLSQILDVAYELLVSGEEKKPKIEYIPVHVQPVGNGTAVLEQPRIVTDEKTKLRFPEYIPTAREKATMKIIHNLPKSVQEEIYDFINSKVKENGK